MTAIFNQTREHGLVEKDRVVVVEVPDRVLVGCAKLVEYERVSAALP